MATSSQVSGLSVTANCSLHCTWESLPYPAFYPTLTGGPGTDPQSCTTEDPRNKGFNLVAHQNHERAPEIWVELVCGDPKPFF